MASKRLTTNQKFASVIRTMSKSEIRDCVYDLFVKWIKNHDKKYSEQIKQVIQEYAEQVDIAKEFREQWNNSHAPWERYSEREGDEFRSGSFAKNIKYENTGDKYRFYNDTQPDLPFWGTYEKKSDDDLSTWIEGDKTTGKSFIHPIPPYYAVDKHGRPDYIIFKGWFDKTEWMNMWYPNDPYMDKAFEDERVKHIFKQVSNDFGKYFIQQIAKRYNEKK